MNPLAAPLNVPFPSVVDGDTDLLRLGFLPNRDTIVLQCKESGVVSPMLSQPYHTVEPRPAYVLFVENGDDIAQTVRLHLADVASLPDRMFAARQEWFEWRPPVPYRAASGDPPLEIGLDTLSGGSLRLFLPPGARRIVALEILPQSRGSGFAGDYLFQVIAQPETTDSDTNRSTASATGQLRLVSPQGKLMEMLPGVWREAARAETVRREPDADRPGFTERFLLGFEEMGDSLDETVDSLPQLFDVDTAPPDFLPWLSQWVGLTVDERWQEMRRRELIRRALSLYRRRGTVRGLADHLELFTGVRPQIGDTPIEGMRLGSEAVLGAATQKLGNIAPHTFRVTISPPHRPSDLSEAVDWDDPALIAALHEIIAANKPVHTAYSLRILPGGALPVADSLENIQESPL